MEDKIKEETPSSPYVNSENESPSRTRSRKRRCLISSEEVGISYEEEKMLNLAIRNSIREQKSTSIRDFTVVKEMKVFRPSEVEFEDPIRYFEYLYKRGAWKYG